LLATTSAPGAIRDGDGHSRDDFDGLAPLKPQREGELGGQVV
jgi:hypothetical protein